MELAELYRKGLPPVTGGALDQSQWFIAFCRAAWADQAYIRAKLGWYGDE
jgi:hypothetical protein